MKLCYALFFMFFPGFLLAQTATIKGIIRDSTNQEALIGANIVSDIKTYAKSNINGEFVLKLSAGQHEIKVTYSGFKEKKIMVSLVENESKSMTILLLAKTEELKMVTVSGSRFEKRAAEEIVSIEVLKPAQILNTANNSMEDALQRVPGVDVVENQVNIRGGSGWSYGAGSRVLVLVDDMPMLTADAGDAKWDFLPLENCEQVEILKGASSSLYGSSALNGVINFRTGFAKNKPRTKMMLYNGMYGNPRDKSWKWWNKQQPGFQGGYFMHSQKFGQLDMVLGSAWYSEDSYLQGDLQRRGRVNLNLRYRSKKIEGLIAGVNTNVQLNKSQTFFFWQPDSINGTRYYQPFGGLADSTTTVNKNQGQRFNIDPYITYNTKGGAKHTLRTRLFRSKNDIPEKQQSSTADTYFGEYQFQKSLNSESSLLKNVNIVAGISSSFSNVVGELYGDHTIYNLAPYAQIEKKINKLWTSFGGRYEINQVDQYKVEQKPVFRAGLNYELGRATFIRASYGQGYRYPSVAERFVKTDFGASKVFPNPQLKSETGWSSEVGIKQGYKIGSWLGFIDMAAFWTEYAQMMEFNFGIYLPADSTIGQVANPQDYLGFKSINVGDTRINGIDLSVMGQGKMLGTNSKFILGYTYMNPTLLNPDSAIISNISGSTRTLKYRYRHSVKFDIENSYRRMTLGTTVLYNSFMQNIDEVFTNSKPDENVFGVIFELGTGLPSTIREFRKKYNKGTLIWDMRLAYQLSKDVKTSFIVKNMLNTVYAERPAIISPPRTYTLQLAVDL
ncbi:MAG: TonB-dependent receptor [Chitinophagaceae bacterium]|nr:TonB-dependent receptor [Chitinophagaceae bacterium]